MAKDSNNGRKRCTCANLMRRDIRRTRRSNPGSKFILQLLGLLSVLAIAPAMPEIIYVRGRNRRQPPSWYPNGPAAWARERGLELDEDLGSEAEQPSPALRPKATASWSRLVKDLNRRPTRERARELIETLVPPEALEWIREMIELEDWMTLRLVGHHRTKEDIREFALLEAMKWQAERMPQIPPAAPTAPDDADEITPPTGPGPK